MGSAVNAASKQNDEITDIEDIHRQAIMQKQSTYTDPATDFMVFTELAHLKRGKCCGNQCRHCPYGWTNVRSERGGFNGTDDNARAVSGDRKGVGRLVKRIMNGTYYEEDDCSDSESESTDQTSASESDTDTSDSDSDVEEIESSDSTNVKEAKNNSQKRVVKGEGKGGRAGGALTSKNVPYTRKGDAGTSQLFNGERRSKDDLLFEAMGSVDELCSIAGVVYADLVSSNGKEGSDDAAKSTTKMGATTNNSVYGELPEQLLDVMSRLFDVGSHIAKPTPQNQQTKTSSSNGNKRNEFNPNHTALLEEWIDTMTDELPELTSFILPTGSPASAQLHVARTVCRRAERRMVPLVHEEGTLDPAALAYVNRLSDYFFTAARFVNYCDGLDEVQYRRENRGLNGKGRQRERVVVTLKK